MSFRSSSERGQGPRDERHFRPEPEDDEGPGRPRRGGGHGHGGGHGRRGGGPGFGGPGFGFGDPGWGRPRGGPRGGPRPRGDVRAAILLLLAEQPRHGYELIQEIAERSDGAWTPSPGSVYPALSALEDEGLIVIEPVAGRKTASLTEAGEEYVEREQERLGDPFTVADSERGSSRAFRDEVRALAEAFAQLARVGTARQQEAGLAVLTAARKDLYRILADDDEG
ncbi:PadR family transcriptional regulator [Actinotalea sp.]|uniref:PadR family transcriptional regulator n=1 Tax=Actinotalea sp. TaxID=1872145 RepID=UPI0035686459